MMLKSKSSQSQRSGWKLLRAGLAGLAVVVGGAAVTAGCLDRPVAPAVPRTSNVYVDEIRQTAVDKIDLLFMIDNSISMADKQAILGDAVPLLVQRLITPICVRSCTKADNCTPAQEKDGIPVNGNADANGICPMGSAPEFSPIKDIHVGVVTSSLGAHGASGAKDPCTDPSADDHAHLLGDIRNTRDNIMPPLKPYDANGFLKWDTTKPPKYNPPGDSNGMTFSGKFTEMVKSSGEHGCGYEASLEAWYRFLIDPEPPSGVAVGADGKSAVTGVDGTVLAQRAAFLRPDSLVAVVMLSDENDCSIQDAGYGYLVATASRDNKTVNMYRSTSQCAANPNDKCCQSCGETQAHDGCPAIASDSECVKGQKLTGMGEDSLNLRCWQQKRRFGFDLLYPTRRYSNGLSQPVVPNHAGESVVNPLFVAAEGKVPRDKGLVFLAGIVGVPWQDIADDDSLKSADSLRYLTAAEIVAKDRWSVILGNPNTDTNDAPVSPTDPLMVETPEDRSTLGLAPNPVIMAPIVASSSTNPKANPINGHEQVNMGASDLQYACIFPLKTPLTCDEAARTADKGCDCFMDDLPYNRPLCQPPGGGQPTITQNFAKAYPGLRHLQVLREFGDNSIVASICPKISDDTNKPDYGYNPAVKSIIDRLKEALKGKCLPRPLVPNNSMDTKDGLEPGQVPCAVIEALPPQAGQSCNCDNAQNRLALDGSDGHASRPALRDAVLAKLEAGKTCTNKASETALPQCSTFCTCELAQLSGQDLQACQNNASAPNVPGYCYINAAPNEPQVGNADLVKDCAADQRRLLRFVGETPARGAIALVACLGASLGSQ